MYWISSSHADKEQKFSECYNLDHVHRGFDGVTFEISKGSQVRLTMRGFEIQTFPYNKLNVG